MKVKRRVMLLMIMVLTIGSCINVYAARKEDKCTNNGYTVYGTLNVAWSWLTPDYGIATTDSNELETHYVSLIAYKNNRIVSSGSKTTYIEKAVYAINAHCNEYRSRSSVKVGNVPKASVTLDIEY